ncbi:MAG: hypothetical protein ACOC3J_07135 [Gemmatimonadota bacterium]
MISVADLKTALNIPSATTDHDGYLADLEEAAVAYVQRATGWYIGEEAEATLIVEGGGGGVLWLPEKVSAVSAVSSQPYEGGDQTAIAEADDDGWALRLPPGETHGMRLVRKGGHGWTRGVEYVVTATIGYAAGTGPGMDREDVRALVSHWFENRLPAEIGTVVGKVPLHVAERIAARRRVRV